MKKLLITTILTTSLASTSLLADSNTVQGDLNQIFADQSQSMAIAGLSHQEMQTTVGALIRPVTVYGSSSNGYYYDSKGNYVRGVTVPSSWFIRTPAQSGGFSR